MRRADGRDVHLQLRVLAHEDAGGARMVEVDVREQQMTHVLQVEPTCAQARLQRNDAGRRAAVEQRRPVVRVQHVRPDHVLGAAVEEIERIRGHVPPDPRIGSYGRKRRTIASARDTTWRWPGALCGRPALTSIVFSCADPRYQPPTVRWLPQNTCSPRM